MATIEATSESQEIKYRHPGFGNFARVPGRVASVICEMGYRIAYVEPIPGSRETDVLLEPVQPGVRRYPPVPVIEKLDISITEPIFP